MFFVKGTVANLVNNQARGALIFTSNKNPALWCDDFEEDTTLLCTLNRIFDDAAVFKLRSESFFANRKDTCN